MPNPNDLLAALDELWRKRGFRTLTISREQNGATVAAFDEAGTWQAEAAPNASQALSKLLKLGDEFDPTEGLL